MDSIKTCTDLRKWALVKSVIKARIDNLIINSSGLWNREKCLEKTATGRKSNILKIPPALFIPHVFAILFTTVKAGAQVLHKHFRS